VIAIFFFADRGLHDLVDYRDIFLFEWKWNIFLLWMVKSMVMG
jgi:hypothetical protein